MKNYKFKGTDTQRRIKYTGEGETPVDLYNNLVDKGVIETTDGDPLELALMDKHGASWNDFRDEDGYISNDKFVEWASEVEGLTDEEIINVIYECKGNAYYSTIYKYNENEGEYEEIE